MQRELELAQTHIQQQQAIIEALSERVSSMEQQQLASEAELEMLRADCAAKAAELQGANARLIQMAEDASGKKAQPGSLLKQMQMAKAKSEALRASQKAQEGLESANQKLKQRTSGAEEQHASGVIGTRLLAKGKPLLEACRSKDGAAKALKASQIGQGVKIEWPEDEKRRKDQLLEHIELQIFAAGKGEFDRTHLLLAGLLERDACRAVLLRDSSNTAKGQKALHKMIETARDTLFCLSSGGTMQGEKRLAFESILSSLIPVDADEQRIIHECSRLLQVDRGAIQRAMKRNADSAGFTGFVSVLHRPRKRRKDFIWLGRKVAAEFWHEMTRLDTRPGKKVKIQVGKND